MYLKASLVVVLAAVAMVKGCGPCGGASPCNSPQCLPPASPYEAMAVALAIPPPSVPAPCLPPSPPPSCVLPGCGPPPSPIQIIQVPSVIVPGPCTPVIELPTPCMPPPQIIAHKAIVSKAVMKPQVFQRLIQVPITARFLKKSLGNVVENIVYTATPKCCGPEAPVPMVYSNAPCSPCAAC